MGTIRTITLTDRSPVRIDTDDWPVIAETSDCDDRTHPEQANQRWTIKVRHNPNRKRTIVYGVYSTNYPAESDRRAGIVVDYTDGDDTDMVVDAVHDVSHEIARDDQRARELAMAVIADLPVEDWT